MEKRILLAFVLSALVMFLYYGFLAPPVPPLEDQPPPTASTAGEAAETKRDPSPPAPLEELRPETEAPVIPKSAPMEETRTEELRADFAQTATIETLRYRVVVSNEGGVLRSLRLRDYFDRDGNPIELINQEAATSLGWPLALETGDPETDEALEAALYAVEENPSGVKMEFLENGLHAFKEFRFDPENHTIQVNAKVTRDGDAMPVSVVWRGGFGDQSKDFEATYRSVVYREEGEFERIYISSVESSRSLGPTTHAGIEDQYFLAMFLPETGSAAQIKAEAFSVGGEDIQTVAVSLAQPSGNLKLYVGPKQQDWLRLAGPSLEHVIDYGFFGILARPLLMGLLWIHSYVGNYGWAIIVLTLFINFVLFPLRLKQQLSMLKMMKIQPQMKTLQDKYKKLKANDPRRQEVQTEMMGLYKKHGVNPMGGCLPLLLQMPFLFAFFSLLSVAIEVRGAPWILWIHDLSQYDPYYILPVLMGGSMIAMQKMTPTTMDPAQARIMMMMPVMLMVLFLWVQSGLMLYWLTSNVVGVGQQYFINRFWAPSPEKRQKSKAPDGPATPVEAKLVEQHRSDDEPKEPKRRKRRGRQK